MTYLPSPVLQTGLIDTNLHANEAPRTFPETSLYKPLQPYINDFIAGKYRTKTMPVEHYAKAFVQNVENGITGKVYIGPISGLMKYVQWWMPTMIWVSVFVTAKGTLGNARSHAVLTDMHTGLRHEDEWASCER